MVSMALFDQRRYSLSRTETIGAVIIVAGGTLWHFVYDWSGHNQLVAMVAPANESVWEHLKLVLVPVSVFGLVESLWVSARARLWWSKLVEIVSSNLFIIAFFYAYTGALGVGSMVAVDIGSFVVAVVLGQWISYRIQVSKRRRPPLLVSAAALVLLFTFFAVVTFSPPHVPLFEVHSNGHFGPAR